MSSPMALMSRKLSFKAKSIFPLENIGSEYIARRDIGNETMEDTNITNPKKKWKNACQLVVKRTKNEQRHKI